MESEEGKNGGFFIDVLGALIEGLCALFNA